MTILPYNHTIFYNQLFSGHDNGTRLADEKYKNTDLIIWLSRIEPMKARNLGEYNIRGVTGKWSLKSNSLFSGWQHWVEFSDDVAMTDEQKLDFTLRFG